MKSFDLVLSDLPSAPPAPDLDIMIQPLYSNFVLKIIMGIALIMFIILSLVIIFLVIFCCHRYQFFFKKVNLKS